MGRRGESSNSKNGEEQTDSDSGASIVCMEDYRRRCSSQNPRRRDSGALVSLILTSLSVTKGLFEIRSPDSGVEFQIRDLDPFGSIARKNQAPSGRPLKKRRGEQEEPKEKQSREPSQASKRNEQEEEWTCRFCKQLNFPFLDQSHTSCSTCHEPRNNKIWKCPKCTFENTGSACTICHYDDAAGQDTEEEDEDR